MSSIQNKENCLAFCTYIEHIDCKGDRGKTAVNLSIKLVVGMVKRENLTPYLRTTLDWKVLRPLITYLPKAYRAENDTVA